MDPHRLYQNFFIFMATVILIHGPSSSSADEYDDCGRSFECGDIKGIGYPFWGGSNRPVHCGHPDFQLNCTTNNVVLMSIFSKDHRVIKIVQDNRTVEAVRSDYQSDVCLGQTEPTNYTTLDTGLYSYTSNTEDLRLFYSCTTNGSPVTVSLPNSFNCPSPQTTNYYFTQTQITASAQAIPTLLASCAKNVLVRIFNSKATTLESTTALPIQTVIDAVNSGFGLSWFPNITAPCDECQTLDSNNRCGFNVSSNQFACYQALGRGVEESSWKRNLVIGISAAVVGLLLIFAIVLCIYKRGCSSSNAMIFWKEDKREDIDVEAFIRDYTSFAPKRYSYLNVKKMTNSFAEVIGKGGYGCVYKGELPDGRHVAVKVLNDSKSNGEDFMNEVASTGRTSHVNIVTLLGFCYQGKKRALIYDYMPNGSLDKFIFNQEHENASRCLDWKTLYEIGLGIARGLGYLHRGCNTRILHFDIKPQNILLDKDFCPKISDFGLAKLWLNKDISIVSMMGARGTAGYIAPEVFSRNFGGVSHKSDVYSYGMLVLEMVGGRRNIDPRVSHTSEIYFPYSIYEDVELDKDLRVLGITDEEEKEIARKMLLVSFWCIQTNPSDRPPMSKVVDMLEGNLEQVQIPPKPFLFSPARSPPQSTELT